MTQYSLDVLRQRYVVEKKPLEASVEQVLRADGRAGARAILALIDKRRFENRSEGQRLRKMLRFETSLWETGHHAVAGVDEAGMSPLAGPVAAAAVILKPGTRIIGIDNSKKLDAAAREELAKEIKEKAESWSVAFVEVEEIDAINIYWAGIQAMQRAVQGTEVDAAAPADRCEAVEGNRHPSAGHHQRATPNPPASPPPPSSRRSSATAVMRMLDVRHPGYGFADHKGYPVPAHYEALARLGACAAHRRSFGPVRKALGLPPLPPWPSASERAAG